MRPPKEVSDEEYAEFYKTTFKQYDTPAAHVHFSLEGQVEFRAMLFLPSSVPWELSQDMFNEKVKPMKRMRRMRLEPGAPPWAATRGARPEAALGPRPPLTLPARSRRRVHAQSL